MREVIFKTTKDSPEERGAFHKWITYQGGSDWTPFTVALVEDLNGTCTEIMQENIRFVNPCSAS